MIILAAPTRENENTSGDRWPHASCLQACLASVCTDWGRPTTQREIDDWFAAQGWDGSTGHSIEQGAAWLEHVGIPANINDGTVSMGSYLPASLTARHEVILEYQCDGWTNPKPAGTTGIRHFVVAYGFDALNVALMNVWYGQNYSYSWDALLAADTKQHIEITGVMPKDGIATPKTSFAVIGG